MIIYGNDVILTAWTTYPTAIATALAPTFEINADQTEATVTFALTTPFAQSILHHHSAGLGSNSTLFAVADLGQSERFRGFIDTTIVEKVNGLKRVRLIIPEYEHTRALHAAAATRGLPDVGAVA